MKTFLFLLGFVFISCSNSSKIRETGTDGYINEYTLVDGLKQGISHSYYQSGAIYRSCYYLDDKRHGECINYFENGIIMQKANYIDGLFNDSMYQYYDNGQLKTCGLMVKDNFWGEFIVYDRNGRLYQKKTYNIVCDTSVLDQNQTYDTLGKLIPELSYYYKIDFFQMATKVAKRDEYFTFNDTLQYGDTLGVRVIFHRNYKIRQSLMAIDTTGNDRYDIDIHTYNGYFYKMDDSLSIANLQKYKLGRNTFRAVVFDIDTAGFVHPFYLKKDFVVVPKK